MKYLCAYTGYPSWPACFAVFLFALVAAAASGCGTVWYKTGSTDSDYEAARSRCNKEGRAKSPDFERCMEEQGWIAKQFGAPAAPGDAKRAVAGDSDANKTIATESPTPKPRAAPAAGDAEQIVPGESPSPASQAEPVTSDVASSPTPSNAPSSQDQIVVKNWFKFGGTADELAAAKERCVTKLGAAGRPEPQSDVVTGAMLDCLRNEGWHQF